MVALSSSNLTPKPQRGPPSNLLHPFHQNPLKTLYKSNYNNNDTFKLKASPAPLFPLTPPKKKPKRFHEKNAFPNSIPIHNRNPHAIYRDIQKFANQNKLKEALAILDYLDHRGIPTNVTTFSSLISACVRVRSIDAAKQVHAHIRINGLEKNEFLQTKLVHMYAGCGSIEDAKRVFETMNITSVYPWNALLRGNVVLGRRNNHEVLDSFLEMQASGVELNVYSYSCLIKSLAGARSLRQGLKTHGILIKNGLLQSCIIRTSLIDMYFKCGKIKLAHNLFEEVEERDVVVWGAMIAGLGHNRLQKEALECTRWMVREGIGVNSVILTSILPVIGEVFARKIGQEVHAYVIKTREYSKQLFIQSALVDMYCKCGDMVSGRKVFYGSKERNTISWTALLSGYVANGRLDQALRSIIWMQQEGFKPDVVTIATVLPVCGKLRALKQGKEIHAYAVKNGFLPSVSVATSLVIMYSKCGTLDYSVRVFDGMEKKNVISWTAMIECYIECQRLHEALGVFRLMQLSKHRPDSVTIARILSVCGQLKVQELGKEVHAQALKKKLESVPFVSAEIVKMYGYCGAVNKAMLAFDAIPCKGSVTWTAIIEAYGCNGQYEEAIHLFKQMMSDDFSPNQFTFKVVLSICEQGGFADEAKMFFTLMTQKYKIKASEEHYSSIINLLIRSGLTEEAEKFMQLSSYAA
ncbi:pentatricopeptide repeat-containing protein At1g71460, chloroplastic [Sesamum indicum]|uniref:Pentatricopeptide repeat-containing protein At1g71460, chloroplastic n=1 Tax=Sesamum indicum TaxID=4182 RepID=A0A6I9TNQ5_SESIN|nr:pentatricopeptide repeat-containing protein At1g71460, chloroplastic [Sesamum indicum]XP_011087671.1 pentatricopeptide repeat-containing protein At1g71460, chloroplastic [Sesamum indicum]XP_020551576.1 pentatricopeptide repeat-containing protein At1g71460, chloroplastic [Sesamum indicum]